MVTSLVAADRNRPLGRFVAAFALLIAALNVLHVPPAAGSTPVTHANDPAAAYVPRRRALETLASHSGESQSFFPQTSPEWLGMDWTKLAAAQRYALHGGGSGVVIRGGKRVQAWGDPKQRYALYSTTKSIGITVLGLALMDGKVRLEDKARRAHLTVELE